MQAQRSSCRDQEQGPEPRCALRSEVFPQPPSIRCLRRSILRLFFRLLYNQLACCYDTVAWAVSLGRWKSWGRVTLPYLVGDRVLELGHGPGHLLIELARQGYRPVGLDASSSMTRQAKRRFCRRDRRDLWIPLVEARAQALPFVDQGFDSVVATFPTEFVIHRRTVDEIRRVLRPKGRFVVALSARFQGKGLASLFLRWLYQVTGQGSLSTNNLMSQLEEARLCPSTSWEAVDQTAVMVVVAEPMAE